MYLFTHQLRPFSWEYSRLGIQGYFSNSEGLGFPLAIFSRRLEDFPRQGSRVQIFPKINQSSLTNILIPVCIMLTGFPDVPIKFTDSWRQFKNVLHNLGLSSFIRIFQGPGKLPQVFQGLFKLWIVTQPAPQPSSSSLLSII